MKKVVAAVVMLFAVALVLGNFTSAGEKKGKEVTLKGTITCAKCDLKLAKKCATVIVVEKGTKKTIYWFDADSHKKHHKPICTEAKKGTVTGTVTKEGKKHIIAVKELKFE